MPEYICPGCSAVLKTADPLPVGRILKCPKCSSTFPVPVEDATVVGNVPRRASQGLEHEEDRSRTHPDYAALHRSRRPPPKNRWPLLLGGVCTLMLLGGGAAYLIYRYQSRALELSPAVKPMAQALAYLPPDSSFLVGLDVAELVDNPEVIRLLEKYGLTGPGKQKIVLAPPSAATASQLVAQSAGSLASFPCGVTGPFYALETGLPNLAAPPNYRQLVKEYLGLELQDIEHAVLAVKIDFALGERDRDRLPGLTLVVKTRASFDRGSLLKTWRADANPRRHENKDYYQGQLRGERCWLSFPSERFLVVSNLPEVDFQKLLPLDGTRTHFAPEVQAMLGKIDECQAWLVFAPSAAERTQIARTKGLSSQISEIVNTSQAFGMWLKIDDLQLHANLALLCNDAAIAVKRAEMVQTTIEGIKIEAQKNLQMLFLFTIVPELRQVYQEVAKSIQVRTDKEMVAVFARAPLAALVEAIFKVVEQAERFLPQKNQIPPVP